MRSRVLSLPVEMIDTICTWESCLVGERTLSGAMSAVLLTLLVGSLTRTASPQSPAEEQGAGGAPHGDLLFESGFEGDVMLGSLTPFGNGAWQRITGLDAETGFTWPPQVWGGTARFQLIAGDEVEIASAALAESMANEIRVVTGPQGDRTRALHQVVRHGAGGAVENWDSTQNAFQIHPGPSGQGDLYLSYWLKFQPDLVERMTTDPWDRGARRLIRAMLPRVLEHAIDNPWAGRVVTDWKTGTGTGDNGDYRIILSVYGDRDAKRLYWTLKGDNVAHCCVPRQNFWELTNVAVPVPVGRWFRVEVFVHRSDGNDGRVWAAVDGREIFDRYGPNVGVNDLPWNRIMPFLNYSTGQRLPAEHWVDDLELWTGFPPTASPH
jgi:hypothetical protein